MLIKVVGKPTHTSSAVIPQKMRAEYNPSTRIQTVECDADIVTLGITLNVLKREFEECLAKLPPDIARQVREVTEEAVSNG